MREPRGFPITRCRTCRSGDLVEILDLGHQAPADAFLTPGQLREAEVHYPLRLLWCAGCALSQLDYVVSPQILFGEDYVYESSVTATFRRHFDGLARTIQGRVSDLAQPLAVDVGSNAGVLLKALRDLGFRVVGIDPAKEVAQQAEAQGIPTITQLFGHGAVDEVLRRFGPATIVTATNVFAHINDLDGFMIQLDRLLTEGGIFVVEAPYFDELVAELQYDTIYHEHLSYLSLRPLIPFFEQHGYIVTDVEFVPMHGKSMRLFVGRAREHAQRSAVGAALAREQATGLHTLDRLRTFAQEAEQASDELAARIASLRGQGHSLAGVSAPAKGMTLLNFAGITRTDLRYITERSIRKIGRFTPGSHIPVVPDSRLEEEPPSYALLLAWNLWQEIVANLAGYRDRGGRFIVPGREIIEV